MDEDICAWPDGDWCWREDLPGMTRKSDDFEIIAFDTPRWHSFEKE